jgi:tellurite resistance protein TerC
LKQAILFPFSDSWWFYAAFVAFITALLILELKVFHRHHHAVTMKEAALWSMVWVGLALLFNLGLYLVLPGILDKNVRLAELMPGGFDSRAIATDLAQKFLTGYLVELSLSVDNLFVFVVIFSYFAIPPAVQHRILFFGILGAIIFRGVFIGASAILMQFEVVVILMGLFLIYTGIKLCIPHDEKIEPEKNPVIRIFRRFVPVTSAFQGPQFFIKDAGRWFATPLFVALLVVEMTDIVFALDSVPAIFGITNETLIVFTSNMFAILGLRTMYFLLANAVDRFHYLKYGLGVILVFVGVKMSALHYFHVDVPNSVSLGVVLGVLAMSIAASFLIPRKPDAPAPEHPGGPG